MTLEIRNTSLFDVNSENPEYALAHCISADLGMGAGIVVMFNNNYDLKSNLTKEFGNFINKWEDDNQGFCIPYNVKSVLTEDCTDMVLNLITKKFVYEKPTYKSLEQSLIDMKNVAVKRNIKKIAMPLIGCGIDGLKWTRVLPIIENVYKDTDIEILVCYLERDIYLLEGTSIAFGEYTLVPVENEDHSIAYWLGKKGYTLSRYCFTTGHGGSTFYEQIKGINAYKAYLEANLQTTFWFVTCTNGNENDVPKRFTDRTYAIDWMRRIAASKIELAFEKELRNAIRDEDGVLVTDDTEKLNDIILDYADSCIDGIEIAPERIVICYKDGSCNVLQLFGL